MTIYDIAKEAGVSISTVSRVLNKSASLKPETEKKVRYVMDKHNFTPNIAARNLVINSTMKTIGVFTIDIRHAHYANTAYTVEQELSKHGFGCILYNTGLQPERQEAYFKLLSQRQVDGLVLIGSVFQESHIEKYIKKYAKKLPIVFANGKFNLDNVYSIFTSEGRAVEDCVEHLVQKGRKHITFVQDSTTVGILVKRKGYVEAMKRAGLDCNIKTFETESTIEGGRDLAKEIIKTKQQVDALIFGEDITAIGAIKEFMENGINVPQDVSIIGCNNSLYSKISTPTLTSVNNNHGLIGVSTARAILDIINGNKVPKDTIIVSEIVFRDSTV